MYIKSCKDESGLEGPSCSSERNGEEDDDEFAAYYKQYRNFNGELGLGGTGDYFRGSSSRASSDEMSDVFSSSNSSSVGSLKSTLANLIPGRLTRKRRPPPPGRSRSEETGIVMAQQQILRRQPYSLDSSTTSRYYLPDLDEDPTPPGNLPPLTLPRKSLTSGNGGCSDENSTNFTGLYNDKMNSIRTYDEASRDSGHSSGGSPDLRAVGLRKRRMINKQPDWFSKRQDSNSIYSFETAHENLNDDYFYDQAASAASASSSTTAFASNSDPSWKTHLDSWSPPSSLKSSSSLELDKNKNDSSLSDKQSYSPSYSCFKMCQSLIKISFLIISTGILIFLCFMSLKNMLCTSNRELKFNLDALATALDENLFGQHIARQEILKSLRNLEYNHHQVIVLLLLGWPGSGKTHTTTLLKNHFPVPQNVHSFSIPLHFPPYSHNHHILDDLSLLIPRSCGYSMVIFDDLDSTSNDYLETITSFIASLKVNPGSKRRSNGTLVVISSNEGGNIINQYMLEQSKLGHKRSMITLSDIVKNLSLNGLNNETLPLVGILRSHGVDVNIIPYLPLTRDHVRKCIQREMNLQGTVASQRDINAILEETPFFSHDFPIFAKTGCKRILGKVDIILGGRNDHY